MRHIRSSSKTSNIFQKSLTPKMFFIIALLLIGSIFYIGYQYIQQNKQLEEHSTSKSIQKFASQHILPVISNAEPTDLCNFSTTLPNGYYFENDYSTNPFFYGLTHKDGMGKMCKIIYGPNYKTGYERFRGENIQINVYPSETTSIEQLTSTSIYKKVTSSLGDERYQRDGYGGKDEIFIYSKENKFFEIIWRNQPNDLEPIIKQIVSQL